MTADRERVDFFISHAGPDTGWAEWVAWTLKEAGHTVELDVWDWPAGGNFVHRMNDALGRCGRVVALWSEAYFDRDRYTDDEWTAVIAKGQRWVPLRIEKVTPPDILRPVIFKDLFGRNIEDARRALLAAIDESGPVRPMLEPMFPGRSMVGVDVAAPLFPGSLPAVWNVPGRSVRFTGRDDLLGRLDELLRSGRMAAVHALYGLGGVGKRSWSARP